MAGIVLYVGGGAMAGVYSAGVLDELAKLGLRDTVEAIYGISAGALNAANFALGDTDRSVTWYTEHAPANNIIKSKNPFLALTGYEVVDASRASQLILEKHILDTQRLIACSTPVYFGVVDAATKEFEWKDARRADVTRLLRATASLVPFSREPVPLDGKRWVDGGFGQTVALHSLRARHPGSKIMIILNTRFDEFSIKRLAGYAVVRIHDAVLAQTWEESIERGKKELLEAIDAHDVLLFRPDSNFPVSIITTDIEVIRQGCAFGVAAVVANKAEIVAFIDDGDFKNDKIVSSIKKGFSFT